MACLLAALANLGGSCHENELCVIWIDYSLSEKRRWLIAVTEQRKEKNFITRSAISVLIMWAGKTKNGYQDFTIFIISPKSKQEPELFNIRNLLDLSFKWYCLRNFVPYTRHCITSVTAKSHYSLSFSLFPFFQDIMGIPLNAPLTAHSVVYTLPMLTIKEDKGERRRWWLFRRVSEDVTLWIVSIVNWVAVSGATKVYQYQYRYLRDRFNSVYSCFHRINLQFLANYKKIIPTARLSQSEHKARPAACRQPEIHQRLARVNTREQVAITSITHTSDWVRDLIQWPSVAMQNKQWVHQRPRCMETTISSMDSNFVCLIESFLLDR